MEEITQKKKLKLFPWIKTINRRFLKSFPGDYDLETLNLFHREIAKELETISISSLNKNEALFSTLSCFYIHFCWKIKWKEDSPHMKSSCAQILSSLFKVGLVLSKGNVESKCLNQVLTALNMFPGDDDSLYGALLHISRLKKKYQPAYSVVLQHILCSNQHRIEAPSTYFKLMLLFRRLKFLPNNLLERAKVVSLATRVPTPIGTICWLISNNLGELCKIKMTRMGHKLMGKKFNKAILKKLREVILPDMYVEKSVILEEENTVDHCFFDYQPTAKNEEIEVIADIHSSKTKKKKKLKNSLSANINKMESEPRNLKENVKVNPETNKQIVKSKRKYIIDDNESTFCNISKKKKTSSNKGHSKVKEKFAKIENQESAIECIDLSVSSDEIQSPIYSDFTTKINYNPPSNSHKKSKKNYKILHSTVSRNEVDENVVDQSLNDHPNFSFFTAAGEIENGSSRKNKKKRKTLNVTQDDIHPQDVIEDQSYLIDNDSVYDQSITNQSNFLYNSSADLESSALKKNKKNKTLNVTQEIHSQDLNDDQSHFNDMLSMTIQYFKNQINSLSTPDSISNASKKRKASRIMPKDLQPGFTNKVENFEEEATSESDVSNYPFYIDNTPTTKRLSAFNKYLREKEQESTVTEKETYKNCEAENDGVGRFLVDDLKVARDSTRKKSYPSRKGNLKKETDGINVSVQSVKEDLLENSFKVDEQPTSVKISKQKNHRKEAFGDVENNEVHTEPGVNLMTPRKRSKKKKCQNSTMITPLKKNLVIKHKEDVKINISDSTKECVGTEIIKELRDVTEESNSNPIVDHPNSLVDLIEETDTPNTKIISELHSDSIVVESKSDRIETNTKSDAEDPIAETKEVMESIDNTAAIAEAKGAEFTDEAIVDSVDEALIESTKAKAIESIDETETVDSIAEAETIEKSVDEAEAVMETDSEVVETIDDTKAIKCVAETEATETEDVVKFTAETEAIETITTTKEVESTVEAVVESIYEAKAIDVIDKTEPVVESVDETEAIVESVDETEAIVESVDETETVVESVDETEAIVESVDETEIVVEYVDETETVVESVDETEAIVESVDKTEAIVESVDETEAVVESVDETEAIVESVDETEAVVESVDETEAVVESVDETEAVVESVDETEAVVESVDETEAVVETKAEIVETIDETKAIEYVAETEAMSIDETIAVEFIGKMEAVESIDEMEAVESIDETEAVGTIDETEAVGTIDEMKAPKTIDETKAIESIDETEAVDFIAETEAAETIAETEAAETIAETEAVETIAETEVVETIVETVVKTIDKMEAVETIDIMEAVESIDKSITVKSITGLDDSIEESNADIQDIPIPADSVPGATQDSSETADTQHFTEVIIDSETENISGKCKPLPMDSGKFIFQAETLEKSITKLKSRVKGILSNVHSNELARECSSPKKKETVYEPSVNNVSPEKSTMSAKYNAEELNVVENDDNLKKVHDWLTANKDIPSITAKINWNPILDIIQENIIRKEFENAVIEEGAYNSNIQDQKRGTIQLSEADCCKKLLKEVREYEFEEDSEKEVASFADEAQDIFMSDIGTDNDIEVSSEEERTVDSIIAALYQRTLIAKYEETADKILIANTVKYVMEKIIKEVERMDNVVKDKSFKKDIKFTPERSQLPKLGNLSNLKPFRFPGEESECLSFVDVLKEKVSDTREIENSQANSHSPAKRKDFYPYRNLAIELLDEKSESNFSDVVSSDKLDETICNNADESTDSYTDDEMMYINSISESTVCVCSKTDVCEEIIIEEFEHAEDYQSEANIDESTKSKSSKQKLQVASTKLSSETSAPKESDIVTDNIANVQSSYEITEGSRRVSGELISLVQTVQVPTVNLGRKCDEKNFHIPKKNSSENSSKKSENQNDMEHAVEEQSPTNTETSKYKQQSEDTKSALSEKLVSKDGETITTRKLRKRYVSSAETENLDIAIEKQQTPERSCRTRLRRKPLTRETPQSIESKTAAPSTSDYLLRPSKRLKKDINIKLRNEFNELSLNSPKPKRHDTVIFEAGVDIQDISAASDGNVESLKVKRLTTRSSASSVANNKNCPPSKGEVELCNLAVEVENGDSYSNKKDLLKKTLNVGRRTTRSVSTKITKYFPVKAKLDLPSVSEIEVEDANSVESSSTENLKVMKRSTRSASLASDERDSKAELNTFVDDKETDVDDFKVNTSKSSKDNVKTIRRSTRVTSLASEKGCSKFKCSQMPMDEESDGEDIDGHSSVSEESLKENAANGEDKSCSKSKAVKSNARAYNLRSNRILVRPSKLNILKKTEDNDYP